MGNTSIIYFFLFTAVITRHNRGNFYVSITQLYSKPLDVVFVHNYFIPLAFQEVSHCWIFHSKCVRKGAAHSPFRGDVHSTHRADINKDASSNWCNLYTGFCRGNMNSLREAEHNTLRGATYSTLEGLHTGPFKGLCVQLS